MSLNDKRRIKVLLAAHVGEPWGGVSIRYSNLLESSLPRRVDLSFVETQDGRENFSATGRLSLQNLLHSVRHILRFTFRFFIFRPDIVHIATAMGTSLAKHSVMVIVAKTFGKKVILAPHCDLSRFLPKQDNIWSKYVIRILRCCNALLVLSKEWESLSLVVPEMRIKYLPNSIELGSYLDIKRNEKNKSDTKIKILLLGHIGLEKGTVDLIEALHMMRDEPLTQIEVNMVGGIGVRPGDVEKIRKLIARYELEKIINIHPAEFGATKIKRIEDADIFLLPSHHEGMPISIIEAMAAELPIIATDVGGIPDLVTPFENGILVPPQQPKLLKEAMTKMIKDDAGRKRMGIASRKRAKEHHQIEPYVDELIGLYKSVLEN